MMRWFSSSSSFSSLLFSCSSCPWLYSSSVTRCFSSYATSLLPSSSSPEIGSSVFCRGWRWSSSFNSAPPRCAATQSKTARHRCTNESSVVVMGAAGDNSSGRSSANLACSCSREPQS
uniref:Putative secreted protein n=1 Tax=Anopheles triannulatus TaxID=58253 RepID=A0A2M4B2A8_9DIPT